MMLACILESQIILWQLLRLEWLLKTGLAQRAKSQSLLLDLDETSFAESVSAVEIAGHFALPIKVLVARRAFHLYSNYSHNYIIHFKKTYFD